MKEESIKRFKEITKESLRYRSLRELELALEMAVMTEQQMKIRVKIIKEFIDERTGQDKPDFKAKQFSD